MLQLRKACMPYTRTPGQMVAFTLAATLILGAGSAWSEEMCDCTDNCKTFVPVPAIDLDISEDTHGNADVIVIPFGQQLTFFNAGVDQDRYTCACEAEPTCVSLDTLKQQWTCSGTFTATGNPDQGDWTSPDGESPTTGIFRWSAVLPGVYTVTLHANDIGNKPPTSTGSSDDAPEGDDPMHEDAPTSSVTVKAIGGPVVSSGGCTGEYPVTKPDGCPTCQEKTVTYKAKWDQPPGTELDWSVDQPQDPVVSTAGVGDNLEVSPVRKSPNQLDVTLNLEYTLDDGFAWANLDIHCQASASTQIAMSNHLFTLPNVTPAWQCVYKYIRLKDQHGYPIHNMFCSEVLTPCLGNWTGGNGPTKCFEEEMPCVNAFNTKHTPNAQPGDWPDRISGGRATPAWTGQHTLYSLCHQTWKAQGALVLHTALHSIGEDPMIHVQTPSPGCPP